MIDIKEMTVLVVDDMENMYTSIRGIMRVLKYGRKVLYAPNAFEGFKMLKNNDIDLVLLDNNMPGMNGSEMLQTMRDDPKTRDLPVIMITADAKQEFVTNAAESEIDAYLLKPITVGLLKERIPAVIDKANNPPPMMQHLKKAYMHEEQGDLEGAISESLRAMEANPASSRPVREAGKYCLMSGDMQQAETYLLKAAKMNPLDVIAFNLLGDMYLAQDDIDSALKYFSKAVRISPRNYERGLSLGKILVSKKMIERAIPVFNKVFELSKEPLQVREEIADYCLMKGAPEYAAKLYSFVVSHDKNRADLFCKLADISMSDGDTEQARVYLTEAQQIDSENIDIKLSLAKLYISEGQIIRADNQLGSILKQEPHHEEARKLRRMCV